MLPDPSSAPDSRAEPPRWDALWWASWFGILAGLVEVAVVLEPRFFQDRLIFQSLQIVWMTPLSYLLYLLPVALIAALAGRLLPRLITTRVQLFGVAFPAIFGLWWLLYPRLYRVAIVLLALGCTVQLIRMVGPRRARFTRFVRRSLPWLVGFVCLLAAGLNLWLVRRERHALATLPAARAGAPNILLLILDTVRAKNLSLYGYGKPTTPMLQRFARRGVLFREAYSTAPWTLASHASMFTGSYPFEISADWLRPLDGARPTLADAARRAGYVTGGFVANLMYTDEETGLARGFAHYEDWPVSFARVADNSSLGFFIINNHAFRLLTGYFDNYSRKRGDRINRDFLHWLGRQDSTRPFFAFLNYFDAHEPYLPPAPYDTMFGPTIPGRERAIIHTRRADGMRPQKIHMSAAETASEEAAYDASLASLDHDLGALFDSLDQRGLLRNTIVAVTADHGELFGEHGLYTHGNSLYSPLLHVPLILVDPRRLPAGRVVNTPVSLRDLAATLVDLAGLDATMLPGRSLASLAAGDSGAGAGSRLLGEIWPPANQPSWFPVARGYMRSLAQPPYFYILNGDGAEELYRSDTDPDETVNLAAETPTDSMLRAAREVVDSFPRVRRDGYLPPRIP